MKPAPEQYDVWLVRSQRVYEGVPFSVVADWLQQGRLTASDRVRRPGRDWKPVSVKKRLTAYLPQAEPRAENAPAAAYEPVELDLVIPHKAGDDDDDVDMIPLIDISLVLLIFFMMTSVVGGGLLVAVPETRYAAPLVGDPGQIVIAIDRRDDGQPSYALAVGDTSPAEGDRELTETVLLARLDARLRSRPPGRGFVVRVAGHATLPFSVVEHLGAKLNERRGAGGIVDIKTDVGEKSP